MSSNHEERSDKPKLRNILQNNDQYSSKILRSWKTKRTRGSAVDQRTKETRKQNAVGDPQLNPGIGRGHTCGKW